ERDGHCAALVIDRELLSCLTEFRAARRDFNRALVDFELHRARALVRQQRDALDRVGQPLSFEFNVLIVALWNHPLVGGELAVDHPRNQYASTNLEEQMVFTALI